MADTTFSITIPNLQALMNAFHQAPDVAKTQFDWAFLNSKIALANATNPSNVPHKTGNLLKLNNWKGLQEPMKFTWSPLVNYAAFVEFGTAPHMIFPKVKKALHWGGDDGPVVKYVHHPGTKPNPFMERIAEEATPRIQGYFEQALEKITEKISEQTK